MLFEILEGAKKAVPNPTCQFCAERLAKGQGPACVEAANKVKPKAMVFGDLDVPGSDIRKVLRSRYSIRRKPELGTGPNVY